MVKQMTGKIAFSVLMLWLVSVAASVLAGGGLDKQAEQNKVETTEIPAKTHTIALLLDGETVLLELEEYLVGVVLSEMPASFHQEAKKAQAVAARTFTLRMAELGYRHGSAAICADPSCCQAYIPPERLLAQDGYEENVALARQAVEETAGMVLTYGGGLIEATYFSCSGGRTEDAVAVWGTEVPYLQAVDSPGEESAAFYTDSVRFTAQEFQSKLGVTLNGTPNQWFGDVEYTDGNGVASMVIGGKAYTGNELRFLLQLRSTRFSVTAFSDGVIFTTRGFGHRVGLSQYGADAVARAGSTWQEILTHYYQGTQVDIY